jgi:hypothetical protein
MITIDGDQLTYAYPLLWPCHALLLSFCLPLGNWFRCCSFTNTVTHSEWPNLQSMQPVANIINKSR